MTRDIETKKIVGGVVIGAISAGLLYYMYCEHNRKTPVLKKIGKTLANVGEMIECCNLDSVNHFAEKVEKRIPQGAEALDHITDWVSKGITMWRKINQ